MPTEESNPRYSVCRTCGRAIVNEGRGFYHEVPDYVYPHFAEPMPVPQ